MEKKKKLTVEWISVEEYLNVDACVECYTSSGRCKIKLHRTEYTNFVLSIFGLDCCFLFLKLVLCLHFDG